MKYGAVRKFFHVIGILIDVWLAALTHVIAEGYEML